MDIQKRPLEKLSPAKYNPRKDLKPGGPEHEKLEKSMETFGYVEPIVIFDKKLNKKQYWKYLENRFSQERAAIIGVIVNRDN